MSLVAASGLAGLVAVVAIATGGCGDDSGDQAEDAGSGGGSSQPGDDDQDSTGGTRFELEEDATKGAVSVLIPDTSECSFAGQYIDFPDGPIDPPVTGTGHSVLVEHGGSAVVSCRFLTVESPVQVSMGITVATDGDSSFVSLAPELEVGVAHPHGFRVQGSGDAPALRAPQGVMCQFTAIEIDVEEGSVWGSFTCPSLTDDEGKESCPDVEGYFYFENCEN